ncbi:hypothetical protein [Helicobacter sp.]|uniref:hypothetical protein n=1 Tax=Helicobacter sp. TaxID=218 RepID=UPI002A74C247|nr:hypothetical protein [Helicobacter sp.]MDY2584697.1 hypothetical protein [Helicobacter sp.]
MDARDSENSVRRLKERYNNVVCVYDFKRERYLEVANLIDVALFCNIYDSAVNSRYQIVNLSQKMLCVYVPYGFTGMLNYDFKHIIHSREYALLWKIYVENQKGLEATLQNSLIKQSSVVVTGYTKMDAIIKHCKTPNKRKKIIIAPHHTMTDWKELQLSNFLVYYEFFLELPKIYSQIDFIFRPHLSVFRVLREHSNLWNNTPESYLAKIEAIPNMTYHNADNYLELFVQSDALIHDCGSYTAEYLYTDNPACFMGRKDTFEHTFSPYGFEVLKHYYLAFSKEYILDFIDRVVLKGKDEMRKQRVEFAKKQIRINAGKAGVKLVESLKEEIFGAGGGVNSSY